MRPTEKSMPCLAAVILALLMVPIAEAQVDYTPEELIFTVYADGYVAVDYTAEVDPTRAKVDIPLFGSLFQDLTVWDQDGLPLDYSPSDGGLTIDTLGSTTVYVSYVTPDLTDKSARTWLFSVSTPIPPSILLPDGATVVDVNVEILAVGSLNGRPLLTTAAGDVEVAYTVGVAGTREHALALIKDAESTIEAIKAKGVIVEEAETLLQGAYAAFYAGSYAEAEERAREAKASALSAEAAAASAEAAMNLASASISAARAEGRTEGLDGAEGLLRQAENAYGLGDYTEAEALAGEAQAAAAGATAPAKPHGWVAVGAAAAALALAASVFILRRGRPASVESAGRVDLDAVFERHPHLRFDDREVLRFLTEAGGEAFAAEIRERFRIPRTSAWRMIRRLQREGIIEVRNVGGQSLVRVRARYRVGGDRT